ncbi:hypothetical protein BAUCODRAFT_34853 [Baudoinia panamericana UAMH 10762]|uniref:WIBG Mago-binding domain-containing protein n=1 Tax=Baudoinia panamericana (strain UAMH 10762) TaxID=717646 RepID=M2MX10_BAUPA|nr:uncharacterized protein BAUCODRAFT_34853 [Baudoinia panamericana UAMH 10762]EMC96078.1 hypothetical protein BAUCODRAFT_34853 [Baudoinia panamericana UAMH 10762]
MASTPNSSNSGITHTPNGASIIPSSTRPDGSVRKEIRVKPGYRPPEDVEVYKNRTAEAFKNRGKGGVPGAAAVASSEDGSGGVAGLPPHKAAAAKNAKRREARKRAAVGGGGAGANGTGEMVNDGDDAHVNGVGDDDSKTTATQVAAEVDPEAEAAKEAKKLAKKLRQARELKDKKEQGGDLLPEQFAKVIKIQELIRQLDALGFNAEGDRKSDEIGGAEKNGEEGEDGKPAG